MAVDRPPDPTAEEFAAWVTPSEALAALSALPPDEATEEVYRRLATGALWAAGSVEETLAFVSDDAPRAVIRWEWWASETAAVVAHPNDRFWRRGRVNVTALVAATEGKTTRTYEHFAVRLHPPTFDRMLRDLGLAAKKREERAWLLARDAADLLAPLYDQPALAKEALIDLAAAGRITTWCTSYILPNPTDLPALRIDDKHHVPLRFWSRFNDVKNREAEDWALGNFCVRYDARLVSAGGVMFCEDDLRGVRELQALFVPPKAAPSLNAQEKLAAEARRIMALYPPPPKPNQRRRGPKPKPFWGDAMAAVEASISSGELLASSLADVERAMRGWISDNDFDAGESTIRNYATVVWERVQRGQ